MNKVNIKVSIDGKSGVQANNEKIGCFGGDIHTHTHTFTLSLSE